MKHIRTRYYQEWYCYMGAVEHMMRFYYKNPDAQISELSPVSHEAWYACHRVVTQLPEREQNILRGYYSASWDERHEPDFRSRLAKANDVTENEMKAMIKRALRLAAIERGLADR